MRWVMRSKLHNAIVTEANLAGEKVLVVSNTSGARLVTYTIARVRGSRAICMNGAAANLIG